MARDYSKDSARSFIEKSKRFLEIAKQTLDKFPGEAAFNSIQATINANDALTVFVLEKRASTDHREAILLHKEAASKIGDSSKLSTLSEELDSRSVTGYDVKRPLKKDECAMLVKRAERFVNWVESKIS